MIVYNNAVLNGVQWMMDELTIMDMRRRCIIACWQLCHSSEGVTPSTVSNLKLAAGTGVIAVSFSYWYNLLVCSFYAQMISSTVNSGNCKGWRTIYGTNK